MASMDRRDFLLSAGTFLAAGAGLKPLAFAAAAAKPKPAAKPDFALRIEPVTLDIGRGVSIQTTAYNGQVPGPLMRLREGVPVNIDVTNATQNEDLTHWHGLAIDPLNDGAME